MTKSRWRQAHFPLYRLVIHWGTAYKTGFREGRVIAIDKDSDGDYVPPEPVYDPASPRPEPREEEPEEPRPGPHRVESPGAPNIFSDSARGRERGQPREEGPGASNIFTDSARARGR